MKTFFKVIFTLFVMFSSLSLVSCKDDDEDKNPAIVGTWVSEVLPVYMDVGFLIYRERLCSSSFSGAWGVPM